MSCIRFNTPAQRRQLATDAPTMRGASDLDGPVAQFLSPAVTASKIARIRKLATDPNPKIRESAASSYHAPDEVYEVLSRDPDPGVRACIAKNEHVSCDILRRLADDPDERVRGFVAINFFVPADAMQRLADDPSLVVRGLVDWKARLAAEAHDTHLVGAGAP
ncbi:hypothetical protein [Microcella sp.]|uniref:hypothetical protein n=1 Tax=Microcella sp. TaxID=1913979 RepID=UPI002562238C|nr:hypothetical protein [Microcella sp.]MBX9470444.1 hypothetical protein [Microcella sp.]